MESSRPQLFGLMSLLSAALSFGSMSSSAAATTGSVPGTIDIALPRHTIIPVLVNTDIRVGGAGEAIQTKDVKLEVAQDVIVSGYLIAQKGDLAEGHLTTSTNVTKRLFSKDVSQEASLDVDDVVNFCGDTIHVSFERTFVGGVRGGFMSLGEHSHDAVFGKGSVLKTQSNRLERSVCVQKTGEAAKPLPSDIIVPDDEVSPSP